MNLTPEQIADNAAAVAAHLRGEDIECYCRTSTPAHTNWGGMVSHVRNGTGFDFEEFLYRPAPKPVPSPLWSRPSHVPVGAVFERTGILALIEAADKHGIQIATYGHRPYSTLAPESRWRWPQSATWLPCTVESTKGAA